MVMVICLFNKISGIRQCYEMAARFSDETGRIGQLHADKKLWWRVAVFPMLLK
jgi:hypothetical protein